MGTYRLTKASGENDTLAGGGLDKPIRFNDAGVAVVELTDEQKLKLDTMTVAQRIVVEDVTPQPEEETPPPKPKPKRRRTTGG